MLRLEIGIIVLKGMLLFVLISSFFLEFLRFPTRCKQIKAFNQHICKKAYWIINSSISFGYHETVFHETFFEGG